MKKARKTVKTAQRKPVRKMKKPVRTVKKPVVRRTSKPVRRANKPIRTVQKSALQNRKSKHYLMDAVSPRVVAATFFIFLLLLMTLWLSGYFFKQGYLALMQLPRVELKFDVPGQKAAVKPFGPFHLVTDLGEARETYRFNGVYRSFNTMRLRSADVALDILEEAQEKHYRVIANLVDSDPCKFWDGENFDMEGLKDPLKWYFADEVMVTGESVLQPYINDHTLWAYQLFNEPHDPTRCMPAIPPEYLDEYAGYVKQLFPRLKVVTGSPPVYLAGHEVENIDASFAQYSRKWLARGVDYATFLERNIAAANQIGPDHKFVASFNVLTAGGFEPEFLEDAGIQACQSDHVMFVTMWRWPSFEVTPEYAGAFRKIAQECSGH